MLREVSYHLMEKQPKSTACWISAAHFVLQYCGEDFPLQQLVDDYYPPPAKPTAGAAAGASSAGSGGQVYESKVSSSTAGAGAAAGTTTTTTTVSAGGLTAGRVAGGSATAASSAKAAGAGVGVGVGAGTAGSGVAEEMQGAGQPKTILANYTKRTGRVPVVDRVSAFSLAAIVARVAASIDANVPVIAAMYSHELQGRWVHAVVIVGIDNTGSRLIIKDPAQGDKAITVDKASFFEDPGYLYKKDYLDKKTNTVIKQVFAYCGFITVYDLDKAAATSASAPDAATKTS